MNLWTFVLLGFLAHSCSGNNCAIDEKLLTEKIHKTVKSHLTSQEDVALPAVNLPDLGIVSSTISGLSGLVVSVTQGSRGSYTVACSGPVTVDSPQAPGLVLDVNLNGIVNLAFSDGNFKLELLGNVLVNTDVIAKPTLTSPGGGLLGGLLGGGLLGGGLLGGVVGTVLDIIDSLLGLLIPHCEKGLVQQTTQILEGALGDVSNLLQSVLASLGTENSAGGGLLTLLPSNYLIVGTNGVRPCVCETGQGQQPGGHNTGDGPGQTAGGGPGQTAGGGPGQTAGGDQGQTTGGGQGQTTGGGQGQTTGGGQGQTTGGGQGQTPGGGQGQTPGGGQGQTPGGGQGQTAGGGQGQTAGGGQGQTTGGGQEQTTGGPGQV